MRIALCLSGQPRNFREAFVYYQRNLFNDYQVDVFIHTWENDVYNTKDVIDLYKPKDFITENYITGYFNKNYPHVANMTKHPASSVISAFYSIFMSSLIKIRHEMSYLKYDWVIRSRFDYALNKLIPFKLLDKNKLYIPDDWQHADRDIGNDQFAFGSSSVMDKYMRTFLHLDEYYNKGEIMNGENMMSANLKKYNLCGNNLIYFDMNNPFSPSNGDILPNSLIRTDYLKWINDK